MDTTAPHSTPAPVAGDDLVLNALYVFYTTDPDDGRIDEAFVGRFLGLQDGRATVERRSLHPLGDYRRVLLNGGAYRAYPLPPEDSPVWQALPALLVAPAGWPAAVRTAKRMGDGESILVAKVTAKSGATRLDVEVPEVPDVLALELCRLLFSSSTR